MSGCYRNRQCRVRCIRPRQRQRRRDMAEDLQALTAGSADMSTVGTLDGVYRYVSAASTELFGWDPAQIEGHHQDEFVHPDDVPSVHATRSSAAASGRTGVATFRFRCADGSYRWTEATLRRVDDAGSQFLVTSVRDITERVRTDAV